MNGTPFNTVYSHHPSEGGDRLDTHLSSVGLLAGSYVHPTKRAPDDTPLETIATVCGWCHDIGKATTWFQRHLDGQHAPRLKSQHSPLGALAAYQCLRTRHASHEDAFIGLIAVAKHHGTLPDVTAYINRNVIKDDERQDILEEQVRDIDDRVDARDVIDEVLDSASEGTLSWSTFHNSITSGDIYDDIREHAMRGPALNHNACSPTFYDAVLSVWAALTKADKTDAASLPEAESPVSMVEGLDRVVFV